MNQNKKLKSPPLVEALLEIKWELEDIGSGVLRDPGFDIAHLRFFEYVKEPFSYVEPLDTLKIPNEMTPHLVKYRYRVKEDGWPLVQLGPGVASLNFTKPYDWDTFLDHAKRLIPNLLQAYEGFDLQISSLLLRYINAEPFDFDECDTLEFVDTQLNTLFRPPVNMKTNYSNRIKGGSWSLQYELTKPLGTGILRFTTATRKEVKSIVWEQNVRSVDEEVPQPDGGENAEIVEWLRLAHDVIEDWFLQIVRGDLLTRYEGGEK